MVYIIKADGSRQIFEKWKVVRSCVRLGLSEKDASIVADRVESEIYEGITTKQILKLIFKHMRKFKPEIKYQIDLREAVCSLRPKPDFELFIARLLEEEGYRVKRNIVLRGKCIDHEIDCIAEKDGDVLYVEIKHHLNPHVFTGVDVFLKSYAKFLDLREGYKIGNHKVNFSKILIVCSTKISDQALRYADCIKISYIAWKVPKKRSLEEIITEKKLYPITFLKSLRFEEQTKLSDNGFILLKDLIKTPIKIIEEKTGMEGKRIEKLVEISKKLL